MRTVLLLLPLMRKCPAWFAVLLLAVAAACVGGRPENVTGTTPQEPITGIPGNEQRVVTVSEFGADWPLSVREGTLGCHLGAVVFRSGGSEYALNERATAPGRPFVSPIWRSSPGPARNPLKRMPQDHRMQIFRDAVRCDGQAEQAPRCKALLRTGHGLTDAELVQIEVEGRQQVWPPLTHRPLTPLLDAGLKLCNQG